MSELETEELDQLLVKEPLDEESAPTWFHSGQSQAWNTDKRIVLMLAGTQGGKTVVGARLLLREIQRTAITGESNDYLIVGPDTELLKKKALPEFASLVSDLAEYRAMDKCFVFSLEGTKHLTGRECRIRVFVGYGHRPESLEAETYKGIWADECGQSSFLLESWEALQRRASINVARLFLTTTPYQSRGWLKSLYDDAMAGRRDDVAVVSFHSIANPAFPLSEFERARREMPTWRFSLFYEGVFGRPAGAVYDCFDREVNLVKPFHIPESWPRYIGVDFGKTNTAAVLLAEDPNSLDLYVFASYHAGGRTIEEHVRAIRRKNTRLVGEFEFGVGGSWSEDEWRRDFLNAGLHLARPVVKEVEVGIQRVYRQLKRGKLKVFSNCEKLISEIESYSRECDDRGEPLEAIQDKEKFHRLDALRYIVGSLRASAEPEISQLSRFSQKYR